MANVCEAWVWTLGEWSVRWGVLIGMVAVWFIVRPPRRCETRHAICLALLFIGAALPLLPQWGPGFWVQSGTDTLPRTIAISAVESAPPALTPTPSMPDLAIADQVTYPADFDRQAAASPAGAPYCTLP